MNPKKMSVLVPFWLLIQFILVFIYLVSIPIFGVLTSVIFWQILTELGYYFAFKLGFHSTPNGKTALVGTAQYFPIPDFIENTDEYLRKINMLTTYERFIRIVFSLSFSMIVTIYLLLVFSFANKFIELGKYYFIIFCMVSWGVSFLSWRGYQRLFAYVFRLDIAWKENRRPVFIRRTKQSKHTT